MLHSSGRVSGPAWSSHPQMALKKKSVQRTARLTAPPRPMALHRNLPLMNRGTHSMYRKLRWILEVKIRQWLVKILILWANYIILHIPGLVRIVVSVMIYFWLFYYLFSFSQWRLVSSWLIYQLGFEWSNSWIHTVLPLANFLIFLLSQNSGTAIHASLRNNCNYFGNPLIIHLPP